MPNEKDAQELNVPQYFFINTKVLDHENFKIKSSNGNRPYMTNGGYEYLVRRICFKFPTLRKPH